MKFHPLANIFPLMEGEEFDALVADIKAHGLCEPIVLFEDMILEGRNRYRACKEAGVDLDHWDKHHLALDADPIAYVVSKNLHRRHLTAEQKREVIAKLIKASPEKSNRRIAKAAKASHPRVAKVRAEMEAAGDVETVTTSIDTKGRKQPAKKARAKTVPPSSPTPTASEVMVAAVLEAGLAAMFDATTTTAEAMPDLAEKLRAAEIKIVGLEDEVKHLKTENAALRERLAVLAPPVDDGIPQCLRRAPKAAAS
jgi:ParB-like chromosome segregation protein Spo0J